MYDFMLLLIYYIYYYLYNLFVHCKICIRKKIEVEGR